MSQNVFIPPAETLHETAPCSQHLYSLFSLSPWIWLLHIYENWQNHLFVFFFSFFFNLLFLFTKTAAERKEANNSGPGGSDQDKWGRDEADTIEVFHVSGVIQYSSSCVWLISLSILPSKIIDVEACVRISFLFTADISLYVYTMTWNHPSRALQAPPAV